MDATPESLSILTLCDGNVCRSPSAQYAIGHRVPGARVESAGFRARPGVTLCQLVSEGIGPEGEDAHEFGTEFRSRHVDDVDIAEFDLVLTATTAHRSELARSHPELRDRFFTLREAAHVLEAVVVAADTTAPISPLELVAAMNRHRGAMPTTMDPPARLRLRVLDPLDIPDAHGDRTKRHRAVVDLALSSAASVGDSLARLIRS